MDREERSGRDVHDAPVRTGRWFQLTLVNTRCGEHLLKKKATERSRGFVVRVERETGLEPATFSLGS